MWLSRPCRDTRKRAGQFKILHLLTRVLTSQALRSDMVSCIDADGTVHYRHNRATEYLKKHAQFVHNLLLGIHIGSGLKDLLIVRPFLSSIASFLEKNKNNLYSNDLFMDEDTKLTTEKIRSTFCTLFYEYSGSGHLIF